MSHLFNKSVVPKWSSRVASLLLLASTLGMGSYGCQNSDSQFANSGSAAPRRNNEVSTEVQAEAHAVVKQVISNIQANDYASLRRSMSPALREKMPNTLKQWLEMFSYQPIIGATDWKFDLTNYSSGMKKIIVHTGFTGADKGAYRTNFVLSHTGESWQIDSIIPLTKQVTPPTPEIRGADKPPGT